MTPRETYPPGVTCFIDTERDGRRRRGRLLRRAVRLVVRRRDAARRAAVRDGQDRRARPWPGSARRSRARRARRGTPTSRRGRRRDRREGRGRRRDGRGRAVRRRRRRAGWRSSPTPRARTFRVWQAGRTAGVPSSSTRPGSWNWSDLETRDIEAAKAFYGAVFGWEFDEVDLGQGPSAMIRVPGLRRPPRVAQPGHARGPQVDGRARGLLGRDRLDAAARARGRRRPLGRHVLGRRRRRDRRPREGASAAPCWSSPSTSRTSASP